MTGGAGLHRLARRRQADQPRPRAAHLRPRRLALPHRRRGRDGARRPRRPRSRRRRASQGCDAVAHLAAMADVNEVVADPARTDRVNVHGTFTLLEAARRGRASSASSTRARSGSTATRPAPSPTTRTRRSCSRLTSTPRPSSRARCTAAPTRRSTACRRTILRFGIPYGPRARPAAVVPAFIARARAGEPLTISGDGSQTPAVRLRRGPRRGDRRRTRPGGRRARLQPRRRGVGERAPDRRHGARARRRRAAPARARPPGRPPASAWSPGARAARRARLARRRRASPTGVRRYLDWLGARTRGARSARRRAARRLRAQPRSPRAARRPSRARSRREL